MNCAKGTWMTRADEVISPYGTPHQSLRDSFDGLTWSQCVADRFLLLPVRPALPPRFFSHCERSAPRPLKGRAYVEGFSSEEKLSASAD